ncbi:MAG: hypothetical protein V9F82_06060 [Dermatophilaceae bacterium]
MSRPRRSPRYSRFLVTGALLGFVAGALVAYLGHQVPNYGAGAQLGYFGGIGAGLGALAAGVVAALLDRDP